MKTLGPTCPDAGYECTRQFYTKLGFRPLEEIHGLWAENPCLIMVKVCGPAVSPDSGSRRRLRARMGIQTASLARTADRNEA